MARTSERRTLGRTPTRTPNQTNDRFVELTASGSTKNIQTMICVKEILFLKFYREEQITYKIKVIKLHEINTTNNAIAISLNY